MGGSAAMNILFIHQNFPGQFRHLAPALEQKRHTVFALTASSNTNAYPIKSVIKYGWKEGHLDPARLGKIEDYAGHALRGEVVALACDQLRRSQGLYPDTVIAHGGWGEALFLKEVWPKARHLQYAEFYYRPHGADVNFDPEFSRDTLASRIAILKQRAFLTQSFEAADRLLSPTHWQASLLPDFARARTTVIHDGIDTDIARPSPKDRPAFLKYPDRGLRLEEGQEVLTFASRNLEPYRGFHIFMRALPAVLKARPNAHVIIIGRTEKGYGPLPPGDRSWKDVLLDEVGSELDLSRVHFAGWQSYAVLLNLLRISRVHAYLSYPFVLSWSMLDAMAAGAMVIGSRTPPVEEVIRDGENGRLVDFFDVAAWSEAIIDALANPERYRPLREAARQTVLQRYDLRRVCLPRLISFAEGTAEADARP
jgi:glycosyltransferase involved in cell wall biosynthesis